MERLLSYENEAAIFRRMRAGHETEGDWNALWRQYRHLVSSLVAREHRPRYSLEDMQADARIPFICAVRGFDPDKGAKFSTYLASAVQRRMWRYRSLGERWFSEAGDAPAPRSFAGHGLHPEEEQEVADPRQGDWSLSPDVQAALRELPANQQIAVRLKMHGKTFKEIGAHLGYSGANAQLLYGAGLKKLRVLLADWEHS